MLSSGSLVFLACLVLLSNTSCVCAENLKLRLEAALSRIDFLGYSENRALTAKKEDFASLSNKRELLQLYSPAKCVWNDVTEDCEVDYLKAASVLSGSDDSFAKHMWFLQKCWGVLNETSCNSKGTCYWSKDSKSCVFFGYAKKHKKSPCVKGAPKYFKYHKASATCQRETSESSCQSTKNCYWTSDEYCAPDRYQIDFKIESFDTFLDQVFELIVPRSNQLMSWFSKKHNTSSLTFDWEVALNSSIPDTNCSKAASSLVCKYGHAFLEVCVPASWYCGGKYSSSYLGCIVDPVCDFDQSQGGCVFSDEVLDKAATAGINALVMTVKRSGDREILNATYSCPYISTRSECTGICAWNNKNQSCQYNDTYVRSVVAAPRKESFAAWNDPVCKYFGYFADSDCANNQNRTFCTVFPKCEWKTGNSCGLAEKELFNFATQHAYDLDDKKKTAWRDCSFYYTQKSCQSA